jgi:branched-chain amino acid transport system substrate-binding protein
MKKGVLIVSLVFLLLGGVVFLNLNRQETSDTYKIGMAVPIDYVRDVSVIIESIEMAVDEINQAGGIFGKPLEVVMVNDKADLTHSIGVAQQFANDEDIQFVIGHWTSETTLATSKIYHMGDKILFTIVSTSPEITRTHVDSVFRLIPNDEDMGKKISSQIAERGYKNVIIYYGKAKPEKNFANIVEQELNRLGVNIVDRVSDVNRDGGFDNAYKKWQYLEADCIVLGYDILVAKDFVKNIRKHDKDMAIMGTEILGRTDVLEELGDDRNNISFITFKNAYPGNDKMADFEKKIKDQYGRDVKSGGATAYDTIYIIKKALEEVGQGATSEALVQYLKEDFTYQGANGTYDFDEYGEVINKPMDMITITDGQYIHDYER